MAEVGARTQVPQVEVSDRAGLGQQRHTASDLEPCRWLSFPKKQNLFPSEIWGTS